MRLEKEKAHIAYEAAALASERQKMVESMNQKVWRVLKLDHANMNKFSFKGTRTLMTTEKATWVEAGDNIKTFCLKVIYLIFYLA